MKSIDRTSTILARSDRNHNFNGKNVMNIKGMPDHNKVHPIAGYHKLIYKIIYAKLMITNPNNIIVCEFIYIPDSEFENHATHYYEMTVID